MTHTDPKPLGGEQYSTPGTSLPAANSPASDERLTQTPEVAVEQNGPGNPGQAVVMEGAPVVPEGAMTVQRAPGSEDGRRERIEAEHLFSFAPGTALQMAAVPVQ